MDENKINEIIKHYPYPIAILYRIIAGMDLNEEPGKGLDYILKTAEAVARLLGMIALAELIFLKENRDVEISAGIKSGFKKKIRRPGFGHWIGFARDGLACLKTSEADIVISELKELFNENGKETQLKTALDKLNKLRNAIAHQKVVLDTTEKQRSAVKIALSYLQVVLTRLDFLKAVSFGYIQSIEVNKRRRKNAKFHHKGKNLKGDSIGKGVNLSQALEHFKETDAVMIRYEKTRYLNLYPFYIYDESCGDAADVFFYNGFEKKRLEYIGIDPGGKFHVINSDPPVNSDMDAEFDRLIAGARQSDTVNLKYATDLHEEFAHIISLLGDDQTGDPDNG